MSDRPCQSNSLTKERSLNQAQVILREIPTPFSQDGFLVDVLEYLDDFLYAEGFAGQSNGSFCFLSR